MPLTRLATSRLHQYPAHDPSGNRQKMRSIMPLNRIDLYKTEICLVNQRCGLKRVAGPLATHVARCQTAQLAVNERDQLVQRIPVTLAPGQQQLGRSSLNRNGGILPLFEVSRAVRRIYRQADRWGQNQGSMGDRRTEEMA